MGFIFIVVVAFVAVGAVGFFIGVKKRGALLNEVASNSDDRKNSDNLNSVCKTKDETARGAFFSTASPDTLREIRGEAQEALDERTEKRKGKILDLMRGEAVTQEKLEECSGEEMPDGIARRDVEKLLDVSDDTARKYLNELEDENKIRQVGDRGRDVRYVLGG